jgi:hypothetical protein
MESLKSPMNDFRPLTVPLVLFSPTWTIVDGTLTIQLASGKIAIPLPQPLPAVEWLSTHPIRLEIHIPCHPSPTISPTNS